jgi:hypothetical protein
MSAGLLCLLAAQRGEAGRLGQPREPLPDLASLRPPFAIIR